VPFEEFGPPDSFEKFKAKARFFLRQHVDHIAVHGVSQEAFTVDPGLDRT
jgi:hypothetical protein